MFDKSVEIHLFCEVRRTTVAHTSMRTVSIVDNVVFALQPGSANTKSKNKRTSTFAYIKNGSPKVYPALLIPPKRLIVPQTRLLTLFRPNGTSDALP